MIAAIDTIVHTAIEKRIFPGAIVLVAQHGTIQHYSAYGTTMYTDPGSQAVTPTTRYDIASLTKVFTATAALQLLDAGHIALDAPAATYLPGLRASGVTIRHLLTHTSGLALQLSTLRDSGAAALRAAVYATEPARTPGTHIAYTNINSLLLGDIVAQVYGQPLDQALRALLLEPLGLHDTCFCPAPALRPQIAPTEWDHAWRGGLVQGSVHDESAHALGGVAGHAGLFSTALDLWRFTQMWLDQGIGAGRRLLQAETVACATRNQTSELERVTSTPITITTSEGFVPHCGLGWMIERPNFMGAAPTATYGHTGFTGPALVIVPQQHLTLVLLSNRTYPHRTPPAHHAVTAAILAAALAHVLGNNLAI